MGADCSGYRECNIGFEIMRRRWLKRIGSEVDLLLLQQPFISRGHVKTNSKLPKSRGPNTNPKRLVRLLLQGHPQK